MCNKKVKESIILSCFTASGIAVLLFIEFFKKAFNNSNFHSGFFVVSAIFAFIFATLNYIHYIKFENEMMVMSRNDQIVRIIMEIVKIVLCILFFVELV